MTEAPGSAGTPWSRGAGDLPESTFRRIVDHTAHPFAVLDQGGVIRYAGHSVTELLGWSAAEVVGRNMIEFLPPDQIGSAIEALAEIDELDRSGAGVPMVFELLRPDGSTSWVEIGAMPVDTPEAQATVIRFRGWDEQRHYDQFLINLLADDPLDAVLESLTLSISASVQACGATIHHGFDGDGFAASSGAGVPPACLDLGEGPWWRAAHTGAAAVMHVDELADPVATAARAAGLQGCWSLPVILDDGMAPAALTIWRQPPGGPLLGHRRVLERAVLHVRLALVHTAEHQRLRHLAAHDALTGVANRTRFHDRLADALAAGERHLAVAFCDLDRFKAVNDTYGHRVGDEVLVEAACRFRACLAADDELARVGGDEFTVLLRSVPDAAGAARVARRLRDSFRAPFRIGEHEIALGVSVGVARAEPGSTAEALLARADASLYRSKRVQHHDGGAGTV